MANVIPMFGGKEAQTYNQVLVEYERALTPSVAKEKEIAAAHDSAAAIIEQLEKNRRG